MTITESSPNTLTTPMGVSTVNDNNLLHTPLFNYQYPLYHYPQYVPQLPQYVPQQPQYVSQPPQYVSQPPQYVPQLPQYVPQLPQYVPQLPQYVPHLPQYVPQLPQYVPQQFQLPLYYPDGCYCEIQYVSPQIVSKSNSSQSSPLASSQPPQTEKDSLAVSM